MIDLDEILIFAISLKFRNYHPVIVENGHIITLMRTNTLDSSLFDIPAFVRQMNITADINQAFDDNGPFYVTETCLMDCEMLTFRHLWKVNFLYTFFLINF